MNNSFIWPLRAQMLSKCKSELKMADCKNGKQSPVETCSLTLRPDVGGKYTCQAANIKDVCTILRCALELKVTGGSRLIQVSNYYYSIIIIIIIIITIILSL